MNKLKLWCEMALYENGELSLTRTMATASWLLFACVSIYLVIKGISWAEYNTFATLTGGGGAVTQLCNKYTNSKYNTEQGSFNQK